MPSPNHESVTLKAPSTDANGSEAQVLNNQDLTRDDRVTADVDAPLAGRFGEKQIRPHTEKGTTENASVAVIGHGQKSKSSAQLRNKFYSDAFAYREPPASTKDQLARESSVIAEVKTNVIVEDEHTFMTEFSDHLAQRFQRSTSAIVLSLVHSACLIYGGSFDPAYILTISALPSFVQASTNKRNAALIQAFLAGALRVPEPRGIVRFCAIVEDNLATNGMTVSGELENLTKATIKDSAVENRRTEKRASKRQHAKIPEETELGGPSEGHSGNETVFAQAHPIPPLPTQKSASDKQAERVQRLGKRRSFRQLIGI